MTHIARLVNLPPNAIIFNGACLSALASTSKMSPVDPTNADVSITRQPGLLHIPRSSYYYQPKTRHLSLEGELRERAMHIVDDVHLEMPYAGARKIAQEAARRTGDTIAPSRRCTTNLMAEMNIHPVYPKPNLSRPAKKAQKHPHLLKNKVVRFPNQAWSIDVSCIPMRRSHMYPTCVID